MPLNFVTVALIIHSSFVICQENSKISPSLLAHLKDGESSNILVSFVNGIDHVLKSISSQSHPDANTKAQVLYESLVTNSDKSQSNVIKIIENSSSEIDFKKFWITNEMVVDDVSLNLLEEIAQDEFVFKIIEEPVEELIPNYKKWDEDTKFAGSVRQYLLQWNLEKIQVPQAWEYMNGNMGDGIVVGILDSGVRLTHETLSQNYLGEYGWLDATEEGKNLPFDDIKHGTHCAGIAVGTKGIGVAPQAKWSACRGCSFGKCRRKNILACGEFFSCPTLPNGKNPDCSKRPNIISNSWFASEQSNYLDMIRVWREIGIIPVFAVGNGNGASCCSAKHPANLEHVISVGSTLKNDMHFKDSCGGNEKNLTIIKPDLVAPGHQITSASGGADDGYIYLSGTSVASSHVAGVIALILSNNNKEMGFEEIRNILINSTDKVEGGSECSTEKELSYPNIYYGHGRVNAFHAVWNLNEE